MSPAIFKVMRSPSTAVLLLPELGKQKPARRQTRVENETFPSDTSRDPNVYRKLEDAAGYTWPVPVLPAGSGITHPHKLYLSRRVGDLTFKVIAESVWLVAFSNAAANL